jgi:hypothetical protein
MIHYTADWLVHDIKYGFKDLSLCSIMTAVCLCDSIIVSVRNEQKLH